MQSSSTGSSCSLQNHLEVVVSSSSTTSPPSANSRPMASKDTRDNCDNVLVLDSLQLISSSSGSCSPKPSSSGLFYSSSTPSSESKEMEIESMSFYKTRICKHWRNGLCPLADKCKYAHGYAELRNPNSSRSRMELDDSSGLEFIIHSDPHLMSSQRYVKTFLFNPQFSPDCISTPPPTVVGSKINYSYFSPQTTHTPYRNSPLGTRHTSASLDLITSFNQTDRSFNPPATISSLTCKSALESSATASDPDLSGNMISAYCSSNANSVSQSALGFTQAPLAANNTSSMRHCNPYLSPQARSYCPRYKSSPELIPTALVNASSGSSFKNASSILTLSQESLAQQANITGGSASNSAIAMTLLSTTNGHPSEHAVSQNIHGPDKSLTFQLMDSPTTVPLLKASEWCPLDDGISVHLPSCSDEPPSREAVNRYIDNYLYIPSERKRLSVFEQICPSDDPSANCKQGFLETSIS